MKYFWGKNVPTRKIRIWELLDKPYVDPKDRLIKRPHLSLDEIFDKLSYLYDKEEFGIKLTKNDCRLDLIDMQRRSGLLRDEEGKFYL